MYPPLENVNGIINDSNFTYQKAGNHEIYEKINDSSVYLR